MANYSNPHSQSTVTNESRTGFYAGIILLGVLTLAVGIGLANRWTIKPGFFGRCWNWIKEKAEGTGRWLSDLPVWGKILLFLLIVAIIAGIGYGIWYIWPPSSGEESTPDMGLEALQLAS